MTTYTFKLMGVIGDRAEKLIEISSDPNISVGEVKEIVKQHYKMAPSIKVTFLVGGKSLNQDHHKWNRVVIINPRKDVIRVMGTR